MEKKTPKVKSKNPFVNDFVKQGILKTPVIMEAFREIDRADFVLPESKTDAYLNEPLSIGKGQTISQPRTVAFMIELLQPEPGDKIFEVGFGSGWQTAILAYIVSQGQNLGKIYAIEIIPEIFRFGRKNIARYGLIKKGTVRTIGGDATVGLRRHAPFDKIIAAAAAEKIPEIWLKELKIGGRLVAPAKESIWLYIKKTGTEFKKQEFPGFVFVPLVGGS